MQSKAAAPGIIVADDDAMIRGIVRANLEAFGQDVFLAYNGREAVTLAAKMNASLVGTRYQNAQTRRLPRLRGNPQTTGL